MDSPTIWIVVTFILCCVSVVRGAEESLVDNNQPWTVSVVVVVAAVIGVVVVVAVCAAQTKVNPHARQLGPPEWTKSLIFKQELGGGFNAVSDGMKNVSPFHVMRNRLGATVTDAARWSLGLTEGKHVFEVYWPDKNNRGYCSCIGLGSEEVPLKRQGRVSLVGEHSQSWGLDLSKRRAIHFTKVQQRLYLGVPTRFFMYIDMDAGKVGFGADVGINGHLAEFYGYILNGIPKNAAKPMYLMVSCCVPNENLQVYYRGTHTPYGGYDLVTSASPLQPPQQIVAIYHIEQHNHAGPGHQQKQPRSPSSTSSSDTEEETPKQQKMKAIEKF